MPSRWEAHLSALSAAALNPAAFGEAVLRPGADPLYGVFDPIGEAAGGGGLGSPVGRAMTLAAQPNPVLYVTAADAAGLAKGDRLSLRGRDYIVASKDPDGGDMVEIRLMPAGASGVDAFEALR